MSFRERSHGAEYGRQHRTSQDANWKEEGSWLRSEYKARKALAAAGNKELFKTVLLRAAFIIVLLFCILWLAAGFSGRQSLVLAAFGGLVFAMFLWFQEPPFVPYCVRVYPNVRSILTDFFLLEDTKEAWREMEEVIKRIPLRYHYTNVWEYGFSISFVTPKLIYDNLGMRFRTKVEMRARLDPSGWGIYEREEDEDEVLAEIVARLLSEQISLFVKENWRGYPGYSLGVVLRKEYWKKVQHNEALKGIPERDIESIGEGGSDVEVRLAIIPNDEFKAYRPVGPNSLAAYESLWRSAKEARARYGWNEPEERWRSTNWFKIEHRYFKVDHWAL